MKIINNLLILASIKWNAFMLFLLGANGWIARKYRPSRSPEVKAQFEHKSINTIQKFVCISAYCTPKTPVFLPNYEFIKKPYKSINVHILDKQSRILAFYGHPGLGNFFFYH